MKDKELELENLRLSILEEAKSIAEDNNETILVSQLEAIEGFSDLDEEDIERIRKELTDSDIDLLKDGFDHKEEEDLEEVDYDSITDDSDIEDDSEEVEDENLDDIQGAFVDDPVKMYLKEIGKLNLQPRKRKLGWPGKWKLGK